MNHKTITFLSFFSLGAIFLDFILYFCFQLLYHYYKTRIFKFINICNLHIHKLFLLDNLLNKIKIDLATK